MVKMFVFRIIIVLELNKKTKLEFMKVHVINFLRLFV